MGSRLEENRHIGQLIADSDRLDVGDRERLRVVGNECQRLAGGQFKIPFNELIPDRLMNALGIALSRREEVDHEQMNALRDEARRGCAKERISVS